MYMYIHIPIHIHIPCYKHKTYIRTKLRHTMYCMHVHTISPPLIGVVVSLLLTEALPVEVERTHVSCQHEHQEGGTQMEELGVVHGGGVGGGGRG